MFLQGEHKIKIGNTNKNDWIIFLDIDGVCSDWDSAAYSLFDIDIKDEKIREEIKKGKRLEEFLEDENEMWKEIDKAGEKWWANLELLPWANKLYDFCKSKTENVCFLTSPSNHPNCVAGKVKWINKHFSTRDFIITPRKEFCARKNTLLIDDSQSKIDKFKEFGGKAFKWPHLFSIKDGDITVEDLMNSIDEEI